jgi:nucleoside-diphosphate-sugar epimerase
MAALPLANVALWQTEEAFDGIVNATYCVLDACVETDSVKKLVYVSSSMVYGDFTQIPMPEDGRKDPKEIYGGMKLAGEYLVKVFSRRLKVPYIIIRPSALYGPTDNNRRVLQIFVENAIQNLPIEVVNPENTNLDFTFVEDAAGGIKLATLADNVVNEDFNITHGEGRTLKEAIDILRRQFPDLQVKARNEQDAFRPNRGALDVSKARRLLGYNTQIGLEEGLKRYVDFVRDVSFGKKIPTQTSH